MRHLATLIGVATLALGCTKEATLRVDPEHFPLPSPPIADCAADHQERGRPSEQPVDSGPEARAAFDGDLKATLPGGLADLHAHEPLCFYLVPDGRLLMRDGLGVEYYFRQDPKWVPERVVVPAGGPSQ